MRIVHGLVAAKNFSFPNTTGLEEQVVGIPGPTLTLQNLYKIHIRV